MKKVFVWVVAVCMLICLCSCSVQGENNGKLQGEKTELFALNTIISITLYGENNEQTVKEINEEIIRLENLFSTTIEGSDIWNINTNSGSFVRVSEETFQVIEQSVRISQTTNGDFDISIFPVVKAWGFVSGEYRVPTEKELNKLLEQVDYHKIQLDKGDMSVKVEEGMQLDLGAVGKGYVSKRISELLKKEGETSAILNFGGNVELVGRKPNATLWSVGVKHPDSEAAFAKVLVENCSVITSGGYQRKFKDKGKEYHHIIDPKNGYPANSGIISATVISENSTLADALSTAFYIGGVDKSTEIYKQYKNINFILLGSNGYVYISKGLEESFQLEEKYKDIKIKVIE